VTLTVQHKRLHDKTGSNAWSFLRNREHPECDPPYPVTISAALLGPQPLFVKRKSCTHLFLRSRSSKTVRAKIPSDHRLWTFTSNGLRCCCDDHCARVYRERGKGVLSNKEVDFALCPFRQAKAPRDYDSQSPASAGNRTDRRRRSPPSSG